MKTRILAFCAFVLSAALPVSALADCAAVGQTTAAEQNGRLLNSTPAKDKDGRDICVVVVLVPSTQGEKPRRVELAVPLKK